MLAVLMTTILALATHYVVGMFSFNFSWGRFMVEGVIPASMWAVACFVSTFRFLSYLDLRIRREGWEVELTVRAAAAKLKQQYS